MKRIIFSIHIDIPDKHLDNPGAFNEHGVKEDTNKSAVAKANFNRFKDRLIAGQMRYAEHIGADYRLRQYDAIYARFMRSIRDKHPEISYYDIINFYKHHLMLEYTKKYDQVCYFDLDIIPNTTDNIFEVFDINNYFAVPHSNGEAEWGKKVSPKYFNTCIRNPATKYWNTHAMLNEIGLEPDRDVFNTGIMVASKRMIHKLNYFSDFRDHLDLMTRVKYDPMSMYPHNIQRVFNYDNETLFSFLVAKNDVPVQLMTAEWHQAVRFADYDPNAKMFHVIDKVFERFFRD